MVDDRHRLDVGRGERPVDRVEVRRRRPRAFDDRVRQPGRPRHGGDALAVHAVGDHHESPARGEDARHCRLERGGPGAGEDDGGEASRRRERGEQPRADRIEECDELELPVAEIPPAERGRHARRDVHRPGIQQDHDVRARRRRSVMASGVCGTRGPGGPGGPSPIRTSRNAGPSRARNASTTCASIVSTRPLHR